VILALPCNRAFKPLLALVQELSEDPSGLKNFLRMDMATFNELLEMVTPIIKRRDTLMRDSISM
jgi:hypothetical protein